MTAEERLEQILETNEELRKVFEKHPERKKLYLQKLREDEGAQWGCATINPAFCKTCAFRHGEPPFADAPEKAYCEIFKRSNSNGKPPDVYYDGEECEYYVKER